MDLSPDDAAPRALRLGAPPEPSGLELMVDALENIVRSPYEQLRAARAQTRVVRRMAGYALEVAGGLFALSGLVRPMPLSSLNGPLGPHRRYAWATTSVDDIKRVRKALGGTFNDVVLAVHHQRVPRAPAVARRGRRARGAHAGAGLGPAARRLGQGGRRRHVREQGLGHVRRAPGRHRGPRAAAPHHHRADEGPQGLQAGGGRGGADLHVGLRPADAARPRDAPGHQGGPAQRQHGHHQRARARSSRSTRPGGG